MAIAGQLKNVPTVVFLFIRFNIIGILATGAYFFSGMALGYYTGLSPLYVHFKAFAISIIISYLGHAYFTFGISGPRYVIRFVVITGLLFCASTVLTAVLSHVFSVQEFWLILIVTAVYPVFSFLLHSIWTFKKPAEPNR